VFRHIWVGRIALLGARFKLDHNSIETISNKTTEDLKVLLLGTSGMQFEVISWELVLKRIRSGEPNWLFISGLDVQINKS
jgi:hypothetical protein